MFMFVFLNLAYLRKMYEFSFFVAIVNGPNSHHNLYRAHALFIHL
jgi:hypothetical protein